MLKPNHHNTTPNENEHFKKEKNNSRMLPLRFELALDWETPGWVADDDNDNECVKRMIEMTA